MLRRLIDPFVGVLATAALLLSGSPVQAQQGSGGAVATPPPTIAVLLDRAAGSLGELLPRLTNVVAEEQYVQKIVSPSKTRTLTSDYLIVRLQETGSVAT